jgi:hypothetical protein
MARSTVSERDRIFISYRRGDAAHYAGRLYDRLSDRLGPEQVFMDVDSIEVGLDFAETIQRALDTCKVLLVLIGPNWLAPDSWGRKRLDDPDDIVRIELESALSREILVVPILIDGARMPAAGELPAAIASIARRNALVLDHSTFRSDTDKLLKAVEAI